MTRGIARTLLVLGAGLSLTSLSCVQPHIIRGKLEGLESLAEQAERNGAIRCAPRELAMAKSHLYFANIEMAQGSLSAAEAHLEIAEPNTHAAFELSPADQCTTSETPKAGDRDGDGYDDADDECPSKAETWNGYQDDDGCPDDLDTDGDGVADARDECVLEPEDKDKYLDDDGCPELDNDLDGIADVADLCKNEPEDPDEYEDSDGCPEPDNDGDTVVDVDDPCPNEAGPANGDRPGCPKKSLAIVTNTEIKILQQIHFAYNRDAIQADSQPIIEAVAALLRQNTKIKVEVQGHTDNKGNAAYNQKLSDRRAAAVMRALIQRGVDSSRLRSKGYGMTRPIVPNDTEQNRSLNRRVQFIRVESERP